MAANQTAQRKVTNSTMLTALPTSKEAAAFLILGKVYIIYAQNHTENLQVQKLDHWNIRETSSIINTGRAVPPRT